MDKTQATPAVCRIELKNGKICGVQATGYCATCERTFCGTHQGYTSDRFGQMVFYIDMCAICAEAQRVEKAKQEEEALAPYNYFFLDTARADLLAAGVQPVNIYSVYTEWKTGRFGLGGRYVDMVLDTRHGWLLGKFRWKYSVPIPYGEEDVVESCLTVLMDVSFGDPWYGSHSGLRRVEPYSTGYKLLSSRDDLGPHTLPVWRELEQAVKHLIGVSN